MTAAPTPACGQRGLGVERGTGPHGRPRYGICWRSRAWRVYARLGGLLCSFRMEAGAAALWSWSVGTRLRPAGGRRRGAQRSLASKWDDPQLGVATLGAAGPRRSSTPPDSLDLGIGLARHPPRPLAAAAWSPARVGSADAMPAGETWWELLMTRSSMARRDRFVVFPCRQGYFAATMASFAPRRLDQA